MPYAKQVNLLRMKQYHMPVVVAQTRTIWINKSSNLSPKMTVLDVKGKLVQKGQKIGDIKFNLSGAQYLPTSDDSDKSVQLVATQKTRQTNFIIRAWRAIVH
ncbi:hypothetical protein GCM10025884_12340 [Leuconostoc gelidum subsp. gelidum]|nr:hypothetical protein GCM10025884_12340 [Leuconostoc gelidum subsp. gelidum]